MDRYELRRWVARAGERLSAAGVASGPHDARVLAEHVLGTALVMVDGATPEQLARLEELLRRRQAREPLQRILGRMWFRGLELTCSPGVFIVRPETEVVAGAAIEAAGAAGTRPVVVDLCTGSGAIAASVATEVPGARVWAVEADPQVAAVARDNCERLVPGRVRVVEADATDPATLAELDGRVDVVVSNPPYVPAGGVEDVETERWDPDLALYGGGADGLRVPVAVVERAARLLRTGGVLVVEHDPGQGEALRDAAREVGFSRAETRPDLTGRERYLQVWM